MKTCIDKTALPLAPTRSRSKHSNVKFSSSWTPEEDQLLFSLVGNQKIINWDNIKSHFTISDKTSQQLMDRWKKVLDPNLIKGAWTAEEDNLIVKWVSQNGPQNWSGLASQLPGRLGKQCRERWVNSLNPQLLRSPWTETEDQILIEQHRILGNKWAQIASFLPGRTDNSVKNRWNSSLKRKLDRLAHGENPVQKRGRRPKRPSMPFPEIQSNKEKSLMNVSGTVPKPQIEKIPTPSFNEMNDFLLSPTLSSGSPTIFSGSFLSPTLIKSPGQNTLKSPIISFAPIPFSLDSVDPTEQN